MNILKSKHEKSRGNTSRWLLVQIVLIAMVFALLAGSHPVLGL